MRKKKGSGWRNESRRHSLASKGIKTANKLPADTWRIMNKLSDQGKEINLENVKAESMREMVKKENPSIKENIRDLRELYDELTTSDLQGVVMVRAKRILENLNMQDDRHNRGFIEEVLLRYGYGGLTKDQALQEIETFKKKGGYVWKC